MRVSLVVGVATLVAVAGLVLDMSQAAPRSAGSDHVSPLLFTPRVAANGTICQRIAGLPTDAAHVEMTLASYGRPMPAFVLRFRDARGGLIAEGSLPAGTREGVVSIPIRTAAGASTETAREACLTGRGGDPFTVGAEGVPINPVSARIDGTPIENRLSLLYLRSGRESWWQLLPTLATRFGLGKSSLFGTWLLPVAALALALLWAACIRLVVRELR